MSRRKTRVTRMSRRKARSGTRKRRGGFLNFLPSWLIPTNWVKKPVDTNAVVTTDEKVADALPETAAPAAQAGGARKTRHRRRHHRK